MLKKLVISNSSPHLSVFDLLGSNKQTNIMCIFRELCVAGVDKLRMNHLNFTNSSNKNANLPIFYPEVNPSDDIIYDRIVI
ncbi:hypothetical protein MN116_008106 [Schistosoma mekongi]|uniref:Uncharacterized protein n=1 Tax=Schistosoma mekongi TaxID=38744 RepID=A0AAE1Z7G9_SCHME|nr:hypothetical protein MN116_008106 [Schistosoma mekongi]